MMVLSDPSTGCVALIFDDDLDRMTVSGHLSEMESGALVYSMAPWGINYKTHEDFVSLAKAISDASQAHWGKN